MYFTIYNPSTGRIVCTLMTSDGQIHPDFLAEHGAAIEGTFDGEVYWVNDGEPTLRPTTNIPETHTIPASTDWILSDVPAGTEVEIDGEVVGTTDENGLTLSFDTPGVWSVTLHSPFPWIEASCEVTVT